MKSLKKVVVLLLLTAMIFTAFAGCGKEDEGADSTPASSQAASQADATTAAEDPLAEHLELSLAMWGIGEAITDQPDAVRDKIYKDLNITIKPMNVT